MKKIMLLVLCMLLSAVFLSGCVVLDFSPGSFNGIRGSGTPETYTYNVGDFTEINIELLCDIEYYSAPSETVTLEIQPNLHEYVVVEESGGVLTVSSSRNILWSIKAPVLTVSIPVLNKLYIAGAGDFTAHDTINADRLSICLDGAGNIYADLDVDALFVSMNGAGRYELSGRADSADFVLDGAGTINALPLQTRDATVNLAGVGTVKVSCSNNLRITADGVGRVEYKGSPHVDLNTDGIVSVHKVS